MLYPNPQIYHRLKTVFVHIPKTAGTSIEQTLDEFCGTTSGGHSTALSIRTKHPDIFKDYFSFAVLRDPETRFRSAFSYLLERPFHPALGNEIVHQAGAIGNFIEMIDARPQIIEDIVHFWPQHRFVCDQQNEVLVDRLFRFEALDTEWLEIARLIGIEEKELRRENASPDSQHDSGNERTLNFIREYYAADYELIDATFD